MHTQTHVGRKIQTWETMETKTLFTQNPFLCASRDEMREYLLRSAKMTCLVFSFLGMFFSLPGSDGSGEILGDGPGSWNPEWMINFLPGCTRFTYLTKGKKKRRLVEKMLVSQQLGLGLPLFRVGQGPSAAAWRCWHTGAFRNVLHICNLQKSPCCLWISKRALKDRKPKVCWFWKHRLTGKLHRPHKPSSLSDNLRAVKHSVDQELRGIGGIYLGCKKNLPCIIWQNIKIRIKSFTL